MIPIILASGSPRRKQILTDAGFEFTVNTNHEVDEVKITNQLLAQENTEKYWIPEILAKEKAMAIAKKTNEPCIIIAADTIVLLDNEILNKPNDLYEARQMLYKLSGKKHTVITGVCLVYANLKRNMEIFNEKTNVYFKRLSAEVIDNYVNENKPLDKAGAYAIQEKIGLIGVEKIEGCYYNVMGLPMSKLYQYIADSGFQTYK